VESLTNVCTFRKKLAGDILARTAAIGAPFGATDLAASYEGSLLEVPNLHRGPVFQHAQQKAGKAQSSGDATTLEGNHAPRRAFNVLAYKRSTAAYHTATNIVGVYS
jgi:hypothetical protein